jgi:hypothetical protein
MELKVKIPAIADAFYDKTSSAANVKKVVDVIRPTYGKIIDLVGLMCNVPSELIESLIFIESGGKNINSPYAVGLMQVSKAAASDGLVREKSNDRLSVGEEKMLKDVLGARYESILGNLKPKQKSTGSTWVTQEDLSIPKFNILVGTIIFKQLMDEFTEENGTVRIDKAIAIYNGGRNSASGKAVVDFKGTTTELIKIVPKETSAYILKLLGTNGLLDALMKK